jgi:hypothetical protein
MAGRLEEGFKTAGVVFSVIVSISRFALSFLNFYFDHIKSSEAVDALLSGMQVIKDINQKEERVVVDLVLVNKGDNAVTVSELLFDVDDDTGTCCGRKKHLNQTRMWQLFQFHCHQNMLFHFQLVLHMVGL